MVDKNDNAVLLDFGLSRVRFETTRTLTDIQEPGNIRFLAPELSMTEGDVRTTEKSDTYSFGMAIYQLLYDVVPFDNLSNKFAVVKTVMAGCIPRRPGLPDDRMKLPTWQHVEEKLWPLLQGTWKVQTERAELDTAHKTVRYLCFKGQGVTELLRDYS